MCARATPEFPFITSLGTHASLSSKEERSETMYKKTKPIKVAAQVPRHPSTQELDLKVASTASSQFDNIH